MTGPGILNLVTLNNRIYAHIGNGIMQSRDGGESWKSVDTSVSRRAFKPIRKVQPRQESMSNIIA